MTGPGPRPSSNAATTSISVIFKTPSHFLLRSLTKIVLLRIVKLSVEITNSVLVACWTGLRGFVFVGYVMPLDYSEEDDQTPEIDTVFCENQSR